MTVKGTAARGLEFGEEVSTETLLRGEESGEGAEDVEQDEVDEEEEEVEEEEEKRLCWQEEEEGEVPVVCEGCECCATREDRLVWHILQAVDPIWHLWHFSLTNPRRQPGLPLEHLEVVIVYVGIVYEEEEEDTTVIIKIIITV